jgi:hypothetical protein
MARAMRFKLTDSDGQAHYWTMWREPKVFNCGGNLAKPYTGPMWIVRTDDGVEQGLEANYLCSLPQVHLMASNRGYVAHLS